MHYPSIEAVFLIIPSLLNTTGLSSRQWAAAAVNSDAATISTRVERARDCFVFHRCHAIQAKAAGEGSDRKLDHPAMGMVEHGDRSAGQREQARGQGERQHAAGRAGDCRDPR